MLKRVLAFWITSVLVVAVISAWSTWIAGNLAPDFGDAFGNFGTPVAILAVLAIPVTVCHGIAALLLQHTLAQGSNRYAFVSSALSGGLYAGLVFLIAPLWLDIPVKPLLLPCALGVIASLFVLLVASLARGRSRVRAA